jgi:4-nitrophenyl phosphatase
MTHTLDLRSIRAVICDMDGVVWLGTEILPGVPDFFTFLTAQQVPFMMATNNSTKAVADYVKRLTGLGLSITEERILSSVVVTCDYLAAHFAPGTPIFVLGSEALEAAILARGFTLDAELAKVVVVGLDFRLSYDRLRLAGQRILAGAAFIGTNADAALPMPGGLIPGSGTMIAAVQTMTNRSPILMGKPQPTMFLSALERLGVPAAHTLMIGDRAETDIAGAQAVGIKTALVLTGVADEDTAHITATPDGVFQSLAALLDHWREQVQQP